MLLLWQSQPESVVGYCTTVCSGGFKQLGPIPYQHAGYQA